MIWTGSFFELPSSKSPLSEAVSPSPAGFYAWTKFSATTYLRNVAALTRWTIVRPFGVYGPWEGTQRLFPYVIDGLLNRRRLDLTEGRQVRDFVYVGDVIEALLLAALSEQACGRLFHIGSGEGHTVRAVVEKITDILGGRALLNFGRVRMNSSEPDCAVADVGLAKRVLGWEPRVNLDSGLLKTIDWFKKNPGIS